MPTRLPQIALLVALFAAVPAHAEDEARPRDYVGVHLGLNDLGPRPAKVDFGNGVVLDAQARLKKGLGGGVMVGHAFDHLRLEAELQYGTFKVEGATVNGTSFSDNKSGRYTAATINALPTLALTRGLTLLAGGGIGWGQINFPQLTVPGGCTCFGVAKKSGLAYQYRGGLEVNLDRHNALFAQYSRLGLVDARDQTLPGVDYGRTWVGTIGLGYRHSFGKSKVRENTAQ